MKDNIAKDSTQKDDGFEREELKDLLEDIKMALERHESKKDVFAMLGKKKRYYDDLPKKEGEKTASIRKE